ncbi:MAG: DUF362 domain-containing protein [Spirochaetes bacterium]|nr:DUF362 domain-containing protein [Spirochaetota bacterium]
MKDKVAIVKCGSYAPTELYDSIKKAISLSQAIDVRGKTVLLKPNILSGAAPEKAVTTHPEFVKQCILCIKELGAEKIIVGDSPGYQSSSFAGKKSGIMQAVLEAGGEWEDFSDSVEIKNPRGALVKSFNLAPVVQKADIIVSLPKMKTHQLLYYTGAMKNLFGLVPGLQKAAFHLRFQKRALFSKMVADLNLCVKPAFAIMDAVTAMEGPGPGSGDPRHVGLVIASNNILALDITAASIMGYKPEKIPVIAEALNTKEWLENITGFETLGEKIEDVKIPDFKKIKILNDITMFRSRLPSFLYKILRKTVVKKPVINHKKCIKCNNCIEICPIAAMEYFPKESREKIVIDYKKCINCYCCHEVCPDKAIVIK